MKRFRFSLHALLTLRQRQEQLALARYGRALQSQRAAAEEVTRTDCLLAEAWTGLRLQLESSCSAGEVAFHRAQCAALEERRRTARNRVQQAEQEVQTSYLQLIEARRQRQVVDKLQERRRREFERETARVEARFLDELALRRRGPLPRLQPAS